MSAGKHSAPDGSFGRSAGGAAFRGALLIAVAVLIGVLLLNATDSSDPFEAAADNGGEPADVTTTTSEVPPVTAAPRPAAEVTVLVANGSSIGGAAGSYTEYLAGLGYQTLEATDTTEKPALAAVYFASGYESEGAAVASSLGLSEGVLNPMPEPPPVGDLGAAHVLVVLDQALAESGPPAA